MDLEITGRHALLFDDDASAAFVNSGDALVEWHSLQIDRYDVRHLLSAPPPSRRRTRSSTDTTTFLQLDEPSLQSQLDYERYLDLILQPDDEPEIEEDEKPPDTGGYRAVGFSYGNSEESADQNSSAAVESSVFLPPFPIPEDLVNSLPPTEKVHQIMARTAIFVSKNGGQSEIILRVKQGDNPTFGFLMPGHHLHAYFRFLVGHPDLRHSEGTHDKGQKDGDDYKSGDGIGGALSLLGSIYGSMEEEDNEDIKETEGTSQNNAVDHAVSSCSNKTDDKDEPLSRKLILSNKEKVIAVKKNSLVTAFKSGCPKGTKKEDKSGSVLAAAGKMKSSTKEKVEPLVMEPPHELKKLIDKLVEFIVRNGKQFEATLIEQDHKDGRFPFLLPSNQYHLYYLKVLQAAQESKYYGKNSGSGKANNLSSLPSGCIPLESDRKEKIKMVIGKSKKELEESESKASKHTSGTSVDAATAAAILQAARRGIKNSNMQMISDNPLGDNSRANSSGGDEAAHLGSSTDAQSSNVVGKSDQTEAPMPEEQKLKAERLKRAKLFVAMLKSGTVPHKPGTSRSSSIEPVHSGTVVDLNIKEKECSLAPPTIHPTASTEKPERNYFDEHIEPPSKRKFRSRSGKYEESEGDDKDYGSRRKYGSKSRRYDEDRELEDSEEREPKHHKRSHRSSSPKEIKGEGESDEDERDHKSHRSYHSRKKDNEYENTNHKQSRRKRRSHHSPHESSRKRRSSKQPSEEEDDPDNRERGHKDSRKKHRHDRSSIHSRDKKRHRDEHSSRGRHHRKHPGSSDDENPSESISNKYKKGAELEEGEISSRALGQSRDTATGHVSRGTSVDIASSNQRASSQPIESSADVPNDLRAKVRAMLMATRLS